MAKTYKTPDVYIEETSWVPPSVAQVETAIPAFIGYTEKAERNGESLLNKPKKITSLDEYQFHFGGDFSPKYAFKPKSTNPKKPDKHFITINGKEKALSCDRNHEMYMYRSLQLFYANGGGACYIVSVGTYNGKPEGVQTKRAALLGERLNQAGEPIEGGLMSLLKEPEPTMIVIPDAVNLSYKECYAVYRKVLSHCGEMMSRIGIFDVHNGFQNRSGGEDDVIQLFREKIGLENLSYGVAYYPWLHSNVINKRDITFENIDLTLTKLSKLLEANAATLIHDFMKADEVNEEANKVLHKGLIALSPTYAYIIKEIGTVMNLLPPSAAMAGIYTSVDNNRGVWKAPANVGVNSVIKPAVTITDQDQDTLNIDLVTGKSINAIRTFPGKGTLVWGARTLDGNSNEWRYINIRRTMIMLEQSVLGDLDSFVFEPNDANTWVKVKSVVENFLTNLWRDGALAGAKPEHAYFVKVGLGETMTALDIREGKMIVSLGIAMVRPAEFIILNMEQQMQES